MKSWRDRMMSHEEARELSAESMAVTRIMKGLGASPRDLGKLCQRFGIEYNEEESAFNRVVMILRMIYDDMKFISFMDVKIGKKASDIYEDLLNTPSTGVVFFRFEGTTTMTSFIKGLELMTSPIGQLLIKPGMRYIAKKKGVELWEQDPVLLIKSFSRKEEQ